MTDITGFIINGEMDWVGYKKAQVESGEICCQCHRKLVLNSNKGHKTLCSSCKSLLDPKDSIENSNFIRCPKCKTAYMPEAFRDSEVFEDGEHDVDCPKCGYFFIIQTTVSYSFESPALDDELDDDDSFDFPDSQPDEFDPDYY